MVSPSRELDDYLKATDLSDSDNPILQVKARVITEGAATPQEMAERIFSFVRDQILFGFNDPNSRASDTLNGGVGFCVTKTNLHVALLRAAGIPARYHQVVLSGELLRKILPTLAYRLVPDTISFHPWCECYLSDHWIACDSLFDKALYEGLLRKGFIDRETIPTIDWDGIHDLNTVKAWMLEDVGTSACLDDVFRKAHTDLPPKVILAVIRLMCNRHIERFRKA